MSSHIIGVVIRDGRPGEVEAIARVNAQAWRESYTGLVPDELLAGIFEERKSVREKFFEKRDPTARLLVVEAADQIVGFAGGLVVKKSLAPRPRSTRSIFSTKQSVRESAGSS